MAPDGAKLPETSIRVQVTRGFLIGALVVLMLSLQGCASANQKTSFFFGWFGLSILLVGLLPCLCGFYIRSKGDARIAFACGAFCCILGFVIMLFGFCFMAFWKAKLCSYSICSDSGLRTKEDYSLIEATTLEECCIGAECLQLELDQPTYCDQYWGSFKKRKNYTDNSAGPGCCNLTTNTRQCKDIMCADGHIPGKLDLPVSRADDAQSLCCASKCRSETCPSGMVHIPEKLEVSIPRAEDAATLCCAFDCSNFQGECRYSRRPERLCPPGGCTAQACCSEKLEDCGQNSNFSGIQCLDGSTDTGSLWQCFQDGTLCNGANSCVRKAGYPTAATLDCGLLDATRCDDRIDCQWNLVDTQIFWQCGASVLTNETALVESECASFSTRSSCNAQDLCQWRIYSKKRCNSGYWQADHCVCPDVFFGVNCEEPVVNFRDSDQCKGAHDKDICVHVVLAGSIDGEGLCKGRGHCHIWQDVKSAVRMVWEFELTDLLMDGLGLFMNLGVCLGAVMPKNDKARDLLLSVVLVLAIIPFLADFTLEILLLWAVGKVDEPLSSLKNSGCFPIGSAYDTMVKLEEQVETIKNLAVANCIVAVFGFLAVCGQIISVRYDFGRLVVPLATIDFFAALAELALSVMSFFLNTMPLKEAVLGMEKDFMEPLSSTFCAYRNSLSPSEAAGIEWESWQHIRWALPTMTISIAAAACISYAAVGKCLQMTEKTTTEHTGD